MGIILRLSLLACFFFLQIIFRLMTKFNYKVYEPLSYLNTHTHTLFDRFSVKQPLFTTFILCFKYYLSIYLSLSLSLYVHVCVCMCIHSFEFIEQTDLCFSKNRLCRHCLLTDDVKKVKSREK